MRGEELTLFFNPDEHAVTATISTPAGVLVREVNVIFSKPVGEIQVGTAEVTSLQPSFQAPTAELQGVKANYIVTIEGETFRVVRRENDGTGLSTVWLRKQ